MRSSKTPLCARSGLMHRSIHSLNLPIGGDRAGAYRRGERAAVHQPQRHRAAPD